MNIRINKLGNLEIERVSGFRPQYCPFSKIEEIEQSCGDWCPLFNEPRKITAFRDDNLQNVVLKICHNEFEVLETVFEDLRGKE